MKKLIIFLVFIFVLSGCEPMTEEEKAEYEKQRQERIKNQPRYEYEDVEVEIVEIQFKRWFTNLRWYLKVKNDEYGLEYEDYGNSSGIWNAPIFYGKQIGDKIKAQIRNTYIKDNLIKKEIISVYYY